MEDLKTKTTMENPNKPCMCGDGSPRYCYDENQHEPNCWTCYYDRPDSEVRGNQIWHVRYDDEGDMFAEQLMLDLDSDQLTWTAWQWELYDDHFRKVTVSHNDDDDDDYLPF
jgi:hypothetical protein